MRVLTIHSGGRETIDALAEDIAHLMVRAVLVDPTQLEAVGPTLPRSGQLTRLRWRAKAPWAYAGMRADNSTLPAPPPTLRPQRIGRDGPKSAALIH